MIDTIPPVKRGSKLQYLEEAVATATPDECLIWPFSKLPNGYGYAQFQGKQQTAHRITLYFCSGEPPSPKHHAAHSCRNRACFNPHHLSWKTCKENNNDDKLRDGTHPADILSPLTLEDAIAIRSDVRRQCVIAADYGVSLGVIHRVKTHKSWKHVGGEPHVRNRISPLTIEDVRAIRADSRTGKVIAGEYGVSAVAINCIKRRKSWAWV